MTDKEKELLAKLEEERAKTKVEETEGLVSLFELSGKSDAEILFEKEIKYYVEKNGETVKLKGDILITSDTYLHLVDVVNSINNLTKLTPENVDKVTTIDKLDMMLEDCFKVTYLETGNEYLIVDPVEKLETVTAILRLATPSIDEYKAKNGNRETRRKHNKNERK